MRCLQRLIAASVLIALSGALAGCGGGALSNFDPSDLLDFLDTKKKLPGDRRAVFPEGVPGLEQGVPKNLYKGSRQEQIDQNAQTAAVAPVEEPRSKRGSKSKRAKQPAQDAAPAAAPDPDAAPEEEGSTAAAPPAPKPKIVRRRTTAPPPDQPAQPTAQQQQSAAPFPAPVPSGSFQR